MDKSEDVAAQAAELADIANDKAQWAHLSANSISRNEYLEQANEYAALSEKLGRTALFLALAESADNMTPAQRRETLRALRDQGRRRKKS